MKATYAITYDDLPCRTPRIWQGGFASFKAAYDSWKEDKSFMPSKRCNTTVCTFPNTVKWNVKPERHLDRKD